MPGIIGYSTIGGATAATADNWTRETYLSASGKTYTAQSGDGQLTARVYGDGTGTCLIGLYNVSAGAANVLIESVTVTIGSGAAWYETAMSTTLTPGTEYTSGIVYWPTGSESWNIRYDAIGTNQLSGNGQGVTFPDPWTNATQGTDAVSFYIDVASGVATEQEGFRFRNDDGSETTATWKAAQDANVTHPLGSNLRLRTLVDTTDDLGATAFTLRYKKSTDSVYVAVPVGAAGAAAPLVEGTAESSVNTAGTSHAVTLPASIAATDMVLITMDIGSTSATLNALTDWAEVLDESAANGLKILQYTGSGVPSNPTFTSSGSTRSASIAWRISGADKSVTPQIGTTATGTSTTPDPPTVTPSAGTKNYLFIAFYGAAGEEADDDTWSDTPPTNYGPTPPLQKSCGTAGTNLGGLIAAAYRQLNTGSAENPGTFAKDVSAAWRAQTIIVHPATAPIFVATSANITAGGEDTTAQLAAPAAGSFTTGRMWDDENGTDTLDLASGNYTELERCLQAQSPAVNGDIYQFREYAGTSPLTTYTVTPEWTIGSGTSPSMPVPPRRPALTYRSPKSRR